MNLFFPQWQGANRRDPIVRGTETLKAYYGDQITHRVITESHTMITSKSIHHYSAIYNQALRCRELLKKEKPERIFTIGGDCGIELMPVSYLNKRYKNLGIIWLDAHADANTPASSTSKNFHGMALRQLCGTGDKSLGELIFSKVRPDQILYLGVRDVDRPEAKWMEKENIFKSPEAEISSLLSTLRARHFQQLYLHFDVDVLDPKDYEHVLLPTKKGMRIAHAMKIIRRLKENFKVVGTSLTEVTAASQKELVPIQSILDLLVFPSNNETSI